MTNNKVPNTTTVLYGNLRHDPGQRKLYSTVHSVSVLSDFYTKGPVYREGEKQLLFGLLQLQSPVPIVVRYLRGRSGTGHVSRRD